MTFDQNLTRENDGETVLQQLEDGVSDLPWIVEWEEGRYHSLVLKSVCEGRVYFYNPQHHPTAPSGATLVQDGPLRRNEGQGLESLLEEDFLQFFETGKACVLIPEE